MQILLSIILLSVWIFPSNSKFDPKKFDYCNIDHKKFDYCKPGADNPNVGEHVACKCEKDPHKRELFETKDELVKFRQAMLDFHNEFRNMVASGKEKAFESKYAADMMIMNWDEEMEYYARCRAKGSLDNKKYGNRFVGHETCTVTQAEGYYGQSYVCVVPVLENKDEMFKLVINQSKRWYKDEISKITDPSILDKLVNNKEYAHLTQLIWSRANRLGCVAIVNEKEYRITELCGVSVICDYASSIDKFPGNLGTSYVYKRVDKNGACSKCYNGTSCDKKSKYPFLCGKLSAVPTGNPASENLLVPKVLVITMAFTIVYL